MCTAPVPLTNFFAPRTFGLAARQASLGPRTLRALRDRQPRPRPYSDQLGCAGPLGARAHVPRIRPPSPGKVGIHGCSIQLYLSKTATLPGLLCGRVNVGVCVHARTWHVHVRLHLCVCVC